MNRRNMFLKVILTGEPVLADIALPIPPLFFLRLAVLAQLNGGNVATHDPVGGDGIAQTHAAVLVLAMKRCWIELILFLGGSSNFVDGRDVALKSSYALKYL